MKEKFIEAGEIVNTHGIRGELRIMPWTDSAEFLQKFQTLYIDGKPRRVTESRVHKQLLLVKLEGVDDVNDAVRMKGKRIFIDREEARLPKGTFFIQDIIGARVMEDGREIGILAEVLETPAGNVYIVRGESEHMIPAVPEFILSTDADAGIIEVRLIEGM